MSFSVVKKRLSDMGVDLPPCPAPLAAYVPVRRTGNLLYVSGQTPVVDGKPAYIGKAGLDISQDDAYAAAKLCAIRLVSALSSVADLDKITIIKVNGYVNCAPDYTDQPKIINGASEFLEAVFGENGKHARAAVGVNSLPGGVVVEVECIAEIV